MAYEFHYTPTGTGVISGKEVLEQTEDAINDLSGQISGDVQIAIDTANNALNTANTASADAQNAINTANTAYTAATNAQNTANMAQNTASNALTAAQNAQNDVNALGNRVTTAEGNITQNTNAITGLTTRMGTAEGNIGNLQTAVSNAQATANSAQQTAATARQQSYVFRYSSTALTASSTNSNTLLDNTDNLKVGDKVIDSSGVIYSVTAIDTANSTFTIGTSLIDLAQDSDVVHKSGDETVGGVKTFTDDTYIRALNFTNEVASPSSSDGAVMPIVTTVTYTDSSPSQSARLNFRITANGDKSLYPHENNQYSFGVASSRWTTLYGYLANLGGAYVGNEASGNERTNLCLLANRDTDSQSGAYIGRFRQNRAQGAMSGGDVSFISFGFLENSIRYSRCFNMGLTDWDTNGEPQTYYFTSTGGKGVLGLSSDRWNDIHTNAINGLNPSALGMPDLDNGIDISSYITVVANANKESLYTPPANGWISVALSRTSGSHAVLLRQGNFASSGHNITQENGTTTCNAMLPVKGGVQVSINSALADGIAFAYFYPCQGNV